MHQSILSIFQATWNFQFSQNIFYYSSSLLTLTTSLKTPTVSLIHMGSCFYVIVVAYWTMLFQGPMMYVYVHSYVP